MEVLIAPDTPLPAKPDAIFPNNWVSFHLDGTVALYPMLAPNRRWERRDEILEQVVRDGRVPRLAHRRSDASRSRSRSISRAPAAWCWIGRIVWPTRALSPRTDLDVLGEFAQQLDYELVTFEAHGRRRRGPCTTPMC